MAFDSGVVDLHAGIRVRINDRDAGGNPRTRIVDTTVGRILIREILQAPRNYGKASERVLRSVVGPHWVDYSGRVNKSFASPEEAQRAFNEWEHQHFADGWHLFNMELDRAALRVEA